MFGPLDGGGIIGGPLPDEGIVFILYAMMSNTILATIILTPMTVPRDNKFPI